MKEVQPAIVDGSSSQAMISGNVPEPIPISNAVPSESQNIDF